MAEEQAAEQVTTEAPAVETQKEDKPKEQAASEPKQPEVKEPKEEKPELKYSDADVDRIIKDRLAREARKKEAEVAEAKKLAEMSEAEKTSYKIEQLQKELEDYRTKDTMSKMTAEARAQLSDKGISAPDGILSSIVTNDAESTKENIDGFADMFTKAVEEEVSARLKKTPPKSSFSGGSSMTRAEIMAIKDADKRQQAIMDNIQIFQ